MKTEIKIKNIPTGYQSIISNGTNTIIGDEPIAVKGTGLGLAPTELVLAGISMCKVATIRNVARRKKIELGDVDAELSQTVIKNDDGTFTTEVISSIKITGDITEEERAYLIKEADNCYVTRLVKGNWVFNQSTQLK